MSRFRTCLAVTACLLAGGALAVTSAAAQDAPRKAKTKAGVRTASAAKGNCTTKYGRGWAWSVDSAKFQAWEIVAQTTGNWPIMSDTFKNERYTCKPDGSQIRCDSRIDVCSKT